MPTRVLQAIRSQPWAIMPDHLRAIEAIAERAMACPELVALSADGHADRYPAALAQMGPRLEGSRTATFRNGVACLPVMGPIFPRANLFTEFSGATSLDIAAADLRAAWANDSVHTVLLVVDSPGGSVVSVAEFAGMVAASPKPVIVHGVGLVCSAAYWIASQAQELVIDRTAIVGSVGVVLTAGGQVQPDGAGCLYVDVVSSNAANKRPDGLTDEGRAVIRAELDQIEQVFIADVAKGRKVNKAAVIRDFNQGGVKVGDAAKAAGMADRIDTLEGTLNRLTRAGARSRAKAEGNREPAASTPPAPEPAPAELPAAEEPRGSAPGAASLALAVRETEMRRRRSGE